MIIECFYTDPPHYHEFPEDWIFGGANGLHPGADPRWMPTTYEYYNGRAERIWITQVPLCDDQALDECTWVGNLGPGFDPVWISVRRPDGSYQMLPWTYKKSEDLLIPTVET